MNALTREDKIKIALGAGVAVLLTWGIKLATRRKKKPKPVDYGLRVGPLCTQWEVTDPVRFSLAREMVWANWISKGVMDPWSLTRAVINKIAPTCRVPSLQKKPNEMRTPGEALFFYGMFADTLCYLMSRNLLNADQVVAKAREAQGWAINQGVDSENELLIDPPCTNKVQPDQPTEPPDWLECDPGTVPFFVNGNWECRCPDGSIPNYVPDPSGGITPVCS